jgi:two-component system cell cycle response regulator
MTATILLVDSDLIDRADWQALLQFHGYTVHAATNGKAALDCFSSVRPDLVLMDSALVDISSDEVCRRLRADPRTGDTPIVVVGSYLNRLKKWHSYEENPGDSSRSPATRTQALDRIRTLLSGGQFNLFGESPETAEARQEANKRRDVDSAMQLDG